MILAVMDICFRYKRIKGQNLPLTDIFVRDCLSEIPILWKIQYAAGDGFFGRRMALVGVWYVRSMAFV